MLIDEETPIDEKREYLQILDTSSARLLKTVSDIMEVSLLASGNKKQTYERFDLRKLINELTDIFAETCQKKNLNFEVKLPDREFPLCFTDRSMLKKSVT